MRENGEVAEGTSIRIFRTLPPEIKSLRKDKDELFSQNNPNVEDLVNKCPEEFIFEHVGYERGLEEVKGKPEKLSRDGYRGSLVFYSGHRDNKEFHNPERFLLNSGNGKAKMMCFEKYGGDIENLDPILQQLDEYGIEVYDKIEDDERKVLQA